MNNPELELSQSLSIVSDDNMVICVHDDGHTEYIPTDTFDDGEEVVCHYCGKIWVLFTVSPDVKKELGKILDPYALENVLNNMSSIHRMLYELYEDGEIEIKQCQYCGDVFATSFTESKGCNKEGCYALETAERIAQRQLELDKQKAELEAARQAQNLILEKARETKEVPKINLSQNRQAPKPKTKKQLPPEERIFKYVSKSVSPQYEGRNGHVYLVIGHNGLSKIGIASDPSKRLKGLQAQSPVPLTLRHTFFSDDYRQAEKILHSYFSEQRKHYEWFNLSDEQIEWFCKLSSDKDLPR